MLTTIRYTPIKELDENRYSAKRMNVDAFKSYKE